MARKKIDRPEVPFPADERIVLKNVPSVDLSMDVVTKLCAGVVEPKKRAFLCYLAVLGNRSRASRAAGVSGSQHWLWRKDDDVFRDRMKDAMCIAAELHEDEMYRRASEGTLEPVYQGGDLVGSVRKFSDTLLIFALKGAMPEKYADRQKVEHSGQVDVVGRLHAARERALGRKK